MSTPSNGLSRCPSRSSCTSPWMITISMYRRALLGPAAPSFQRRCRLRLLPERRSPRMNCRYRPWAPGSLWNTRPTNSWFCAATPTTGKWTRAASSCPTWMRFSSRKAPSGVGRTLNTMAGSGDHSNLENPSVFIETLKRAGEPDAHFSSNGVPRPWLFAP